jgi:aspartyl-tRNA(Asn)/glutamyl-tRNA(Gln) amidotransferase subunit A
VVGLKQTYGLASRHGIYPLCERFDHGGPLARSVTDAALLVQAIAGADAGDPSTRSARVSDYTAKLGQDIAGMRIGVPRQYFFERLHPEVEDSVRAAARSLEALGARVDEIDLPFDAQAAGRAWDIITLADAHALHEAHLRDHGEAMSRDIRARMQRGGDMTPEDVAAAERTRERTKQGMAALAATIDVLLAPTTPIPAVPLDTCEIEVRGQTVDGVKVLGRLTRLAAFTGQPAISLPCGFTGDGLPVGLQLIGSWFAEADLLRVAYAYEQAAEWRERRPPPAAA